MGPIPLGALCPRNDACGTLVRDSIPTGYKLMRRLLHSEEGRRLGYRLTKRNPHFNGERGSTGNAERTSICGIMGRASLWLGTRFRRQPLAPSGATLRAPGVDRSARPSKGTAMP